MADGIAPVAWSGRWAVVTFPERAGGPEAAEIGEQLLAALSRGAATLIVDMSATVWCDRGAVDAVARACLRAVTSQAELRLVISAPDVLRLVSAEGLDRLVPVYASLQAALDAGAPDGPAAGDPGRAVPVPAWPRPETGRDDGAGLPAPVSEAVLRHLIDALDDGVALAAADGTIVLANRRLAAMFGYQPGELAGQPVEALIPASLREAHREHRAGYAREPAVRPMADRARLVGVRKDGGTVPVTITLSPVRAADGHLVLAVVREAAPPRQRHDLATVLSAAAREAEDSRDLLDQVVGILFHAGLALEAAAGLPADVARERISEALRRLDDIIHDIRDHVFRSRRPGGAR